MAHMLLIVEPRGQREARTETEGREVYARMLAWGDGLRERGLLLASSSLRPDHSGVRVQTRDGRKSLMDGPFAEAKEMVGGFFLLNCERMQDAVAIAGECPAAEWASVEVRETGPCYVG